MSEAILERMRWFVPLSDNLAVRRGLTDDERCALAWLGIADEARRDMGGQGCAEALLIDGLVIVATAECNGAPTMELHRVSELAALYREAQLL